MGKRFLTYITGLVKLAYFNYLFGFQFGTAMVLSYFASPVRVCKRDLNIFGSYMQPIFTTGDFTNGLAFYPEHRSKFFLRNVPLRIKVANFSNDFRRYFGTVDAFTPGPTFRVAFRAVVFACCRLKSAFRNHIGGVFLGRSAIQMETITAGWVIASMANKVFKRVFAVCQEICHTMSFNSPAINFELAVTTGKTRTFPGPTFVKALTFDVLPKPLNVA